MRRRFGPIALYILGASLVFAAVTVVNGDAVLAPLLACMGLLCVVWSTLLSGGASDE